MAAAEEMPDWIPNTSPRTGWFLLVALIAVSMLVCSFKSGRLTIASGDTPQYLDAAYHVAIHHNFTADPSAAYASPDIGREPGYPLFLALLMAIDPGFGSFTPSCLMPGSNCDPRIYRSASWANLFFIALTGTTVFLIGMLVFRNVLGALVAASYVLFNFQMNKGWADPNSDRLAVWLVCLCLLAMVWAWQRGAWRWAFVGLALAALTLTKLVFLPYCGLLGIGAGATALFRPAVRRQVLLSLAAGGLLYGGTVGGWVARNWQTTGMVRLTDYRGGQALSTREALDHMSGEQYVAAFVYWTRGFGERLATRLFPAEVIAPFDLYRPDGFYERGQTGYLFRLEDTMDFQDVDVWEAASIVDHQVGQAILGHPLAYIATTLPVFYRGIWIDEFVLFGFPLFCWMLIRAFRRRDALLGLLLSAGAYNLLIYPLITLNIPRYQMTAVPAMALAAGMAVAIGHRSKAPLGVARVET